jgi:hypothetical protein
MSKLFRMSVVTTLCLIGFASVATAQNINWNQANHGICGDLTSATPGLFGLCVAFCEAHGCEPDLTAMDPFADCKPSDPKLLDLYNGLKQPADPDMPCVVVEPEGGCPCFTQEQVDAIPTPYAQCAIDSDLGILNPAELYTNIIDVLGSGAGTAIGDSYSTCGYFNGFVDPPISVSLQTNAAQAQECRQIIVNTITTNADQCELLSDPVCEP